MTPTEWLTNSMDLRGRKGGRASDLSGPWRPDWAAPGFDECAASHQEGGWRL